MNAHTATPLRPRSRSRRLRAAASVAVVALLGVACGSAAPDPGGGPDAEVGFRVVATTDVVREVVAAVLGDRGEVELLVEPGIDPHQFQPSAQQVEALRGADLVVAVGLGLEAGLADVLAAAEQDGVPVVSLAPQLDPLPFSGGHGHDHADEGAEPRDHDDDHDDGHEADGVDLDEAQLDPHVWLDPVRWSGAPIVVARALREAGAPEPEGGWDRRGADVAADIAAQEATVRAVLDVVPERCRLLVTNHDALGYLAARFDFEVVGTVLPGASSEADPSAREFAALVEVVREAGVPAIFSDQSGSSRLAEALAAEVGDVEVVALVGDAVAGGLLDSAERIAAALSAC